MKKLIQQKIDKLKLDVLYFENNLLIYPESSFSYARSTAGLALTQLKIEINKELLNLLNKFSRIRIW